MKDWNIGLASAIFKFQFQPDVLRNVDKPRPPLRKMAEIRRYLPGHFKCTLFAAYPVKKTNPRSDQTTPILPREFYSKEFSALLLLFAWIQFLIRCLETHLVIELFMIHSCERPEKTVTFDIARIGYGEVTSVSCVSPRINFFFSIRCTNAFWNKSDIGKWTGKAIN